jgi:hypothetical protein
MRLWRQAYYYSNLPDRGPSDGCRLTWIVDPLLLRILRAFLHTFSAALDGVFRALGAPLGVVLRRVICLLRAVLHSAAGVLGSLFGFVARTLRILLGCVVFTGIGLLAESKERGDSQGSSEQQCRYL